MIITATKAQQQRAIDRAHARGGAKRVTWRGGYAYDVEGTDTIYRVWWQGLHNVACNCPAGSHGKLCVHIAHVWIRRMGQEALVRGRQVVA